MRSDTRVIARTILKSETRVKTKENLRKTKNSKFFPWGDLKGKLRRKSRKTWEVSQNKGLKIWVATATPEQQDQDQEDREVLPETQEEEDKEDEGS